MSATSHLTMHQDHLAWHEEIRSWQEDLQTWRNEMTQVKQSLPALEKAFDDHLQTLASNAAALEKSRQHIGAHEDALVDYERGDTAQRLIGMAAEHVDQAAQQKRERKEHAALARHHREVLAHWRRLVRELIPGGDQA